MTAVLLQISDPHFGTERPLVVEALRQLTVTQAPDLIVLSGDITQRAHFAQYEAARAFLDSLPIPHKLVIPGNHDIPLFNLIARIFRPYAAYCQAFGTELEPTFESPALLVLALNTTRPWRHKDGEISEAQVARIAHLLEKASPAQLRVVVTHQPIAVIRPQDEDNLLHGRDAAIQAWSRAGADLILGGHIHLPFIAALHEQIPALPRRMWAVQAGTALSRRIRHEAGNSVNVIRYAGLKPQEQCRAATLERWDYHEEKNVFQRVAVTSICSG
jgi:3',5'-cyclic AMP phosphodiesterase CpdA